MWKALALFTLLAALTGCAKNGPLELTLDQVPEALRQAFATAKTGLLKTSAESVAKLVAEKHYAAASLQLQALSANSDLTNEQRSVVAGATVAVNAALQEIAASAPYPPASAPSAPPTTTDASQEDAAAAAAVLDHYKRTK